MIPKSRIHRLRRRCGRAAPLIGGWSIGLAAASLLFMVIVSSHAEMGIRAFGLFFASAVSGYLARYALDTMEACLERDYLTAVWMLLWTGITGFIVFTGVTILMVGLPNHL